MNQSSRRLVLNSDELTKAVSYWLEFERLCGRAELLSEMSLRLPIGHYLIATQDHVLKSEQPYPNEMQLRQGRPKSMDFCLMRRGGARVVKYIFESKWVNGKRDITQELIDDLVRLEGVTYLDQAEPIERIFLLAGGTKEVGKYLGKVLPNEVDVPTKIPVMAEGAPLLEKWKAAARSAKFNELPLSMMVTLKAKSEMPSHGCWLWRVKRAQKRSTRSLN